MLVTFLSKAIQIKQNQFGEATIFQESQNHIPGTRADWSTISPNMNFNAMHLVSCLEQHSFLTPLWEDVESDDEEISIIKSRLQTMGYLD